METLQHSHDVLALAYRPDGKLLASATLDGQIYLWDPQEAQLLVCALTTITHAIIHAIRHPSHVESLFPLTNNIRHAACSCQCASILHYTTTTVRNASRSVSVGYCSFGRLPLLHPAMYRLSCALLLHRFCVSIALALKDDAADHARPCRSAAGLWQPNRLTLVSGRPFLGVPNMPRHSFGWSTLFLCLCYFCFNQSVLCL